MAGPAGWSIDRESHPPIARAEALANLPWLRHAFTLRDPASTHDFDLSFTTSPDAGRVRANRSAICERLGFPPASLTMPAMPHSAAAARLFLPDRGCGGMDRAAAVPGCDALITDVPGLLLAVTAADCLSVCLVDPVHRAIGLAHSGWRGTAGRIVPNTLHAMERAFGTRPGECLAAIGPGVSGAGYEVDSPVYEAFAHGPEKAHVFRPTSPGHWLLDLTAAIRYQLLTCGLPSEALSVSPWRTDIDTALCHSHRLHPGCPRMGAFLGRAV